MSKFREDGSYSEISGRVYFSPDEPASSAFDDQLMIVHDDNGQPVSKEGFLSMLEEDGMQEADTQPSDVT